MINQTINTDITVIGAGLSGLLIANMLSSKNINVVLIEKNKIQESTEDTRNIAISYKTSQILSNFEIWDKISDKTGKIENIYINGKFGFMQYSHKEIFNNIRPIGYTAHYNDLINALQLSAKHNKKITILDNTTYDNFQINAEYASIKTKCQKTINSKLIICSDGKNSAMRKAMNFKINKFDYNQKCISLDIQHTNKSNNSIIEYFDKKYTFALIPTKDQKISSITLIANNDDSQTIKSMNEYEFIKFINKMIPIQFGDVLKIGKMIDYPLIMQYATHYYKERFVLMGDALHAIHPTTGQGFNINAYDSNILFNEILNAHSEKKDIGSQDILSNFMKKRKISNNATIHYTDKIIKAFYKKIPFIDYFFSIGFNFINKNQFIKKKIIE